MQMLWNPQQFPLPLASKALVCSGQEKWQIQVPNTKLAQPSVLSQNTLEGDDWVEEGGFQQEVNFQLFKWKKTEN